MDHFSRARVISRERRSILIEMFDTPEIADAFSGAAAMYNNLGSDYREKLTLIDGRIEYKKQYLQGLLKQLPNYQGPKPVAVEESSKETVSPATPVDFDRITLKWLFEHLPANKWWAYFGVLLALFLGSFVGGVRVGETTLVKELFGKTSNSPTASKLTTDEFKMRIDQVIQGHNQRRQKLVEAIIDEQHRLSDIGSNYATRQHAISDLHMDMDKEEVTFQNDLKMLTSFQK